MLLVATSEKNENLKRLHAEVTVREVKMTKQLLKESFRVLFIRKFRPRGFYIN